MPRILGPADPGAFPGRSPPPRPSAPCARLPRGAPPPSPSHLCSRFRRVGHRTRAPGKTGRGSVGRKGSRGASAVRGWGPLSAVEPPTSPGPRGLPTGCQRTGRACLSFLLFLLPPLSFSSLPQPHPVSPAPPPSPPPPPPAAIPPPGPLPRLGRFPERVCVKAAESRQENGVQNIAQPVLIAPCPAFPSPGALPTSLS